MSQPQKTLFGALALAQGLHFAAFVLFWGGWFSAISLPLAWTVFFLTGWNLVLAVQVSRRCPWAEPMAKTYAMACALRLLVFLCVILLPLLQMKTSPGPVGPFALSLTTSMLMHVLGFATLVKVPRAYA